MLDRHPDHCAAFSHQVDGTELEACSPSFFGVYASIYPIHPRSCSITWMEPRDTLRLCHSYSFRRWNHVSEPNGEVYDHVDIDADSLACWDESLPYSPAFDGRFGTVPLETAEKVASREAKSLSLVELLHGCGNEDYKNWSLGDEATEAAVGLVKRIKASFKPRNSFLVVDENEIETHYNGGAEKIKASFVELAKKTGAELHWVGSYEKSREEFCRRQLFLYRKVQEAIKGGRVFVGSNSHAVVWVTKKPSFAFKTEMEKREFINYLDCKVS